MRGSVVIMLLLLLAAGVPKSQAQDGGGLPSGEIPWAAFQYPNINTPTPLASPTPTMTFTPTGTLTPTATGTAGTPSGSVMTPTSPAPPPTLNPDTSFLDFEGSDLNHQMSTMQAIMSNNAAPTINDVNGTAVNLNQVSNLAANGTTLLSYIKGLSTLNIGFLTPLVQLLLLNFTITLTMHMLSFLIPLGASLLGLARKAISLVMDFIPG